LAIRKAINDADMNAMMIPKTILKVDSIPKLGSGKTDFSGVKKLVLEMMAKVELTA
jgi:acyl-[acyl-carrier-protein]-phospholipid O-acyltransferase / long-chain-fatty-acid--[acyl-carrier-protein] ligase